MTPSPVAPPAMPLPDPRGMRGTRLAFAHSSNGNRSSASRGTTTARGMARAMPAPSA
jgi:hypothetical protein